MLLADDDQSYVVKFSNNPQDRRVLVNEAICYVLLDYLGLPTPGWEVVEVPQTLIDLDPALCLTQGRETEPCAAGLHFGSRFPLERTRQAVYECLPVSRLRTRLVFRFDSGYEARGEQQLLHALGGRSAVQEATRLGFVMDRGCAIANRSDRSRRSVKRAWLTKLSNCWNSVPSLACQ